MADVRSVLVLETALTCVKLPSWVHFNNIWIDPLGFQVPLFVGTRNSMRNPSWQLWAALRGAAAGVAADGAEMQLKRGRGGGQGMAAVWPRVAAVVAKGGRSGRSDRALLQPPGPGPGRAGAGAADRPGGHRGHGQGHPHQLLRRAQV